MLDVSSGQQARDISAGEQVKAASRNYERLAGTDPGTKAPRPRNDLACADGAGGKVYTFPGAGASEPGVILG
jgi:hypothetical protein